MGLGAKLKRIILGEANNAVEKMEDPTKISEQIIRELGDNLSRAKNSEASVKAIALKNKSDLAKAKEELISWEGKVNGILDRIDKTGSTEELEGLAKLATQHYNDTLIKVNKTEELSKISDSQVETMDNNIKTLQTRINEAKDKTKNIAARQQVAEASKVINMSLSSDNSEGLMSTLDRMEEKTSKDEFIAEAYAEGASNTSDEAKINAVLGNTSVEDTLAAFKAKRASK